MTYCTCIFCSNSCEQETATTYLSVLCGKDFSWSEEMAKQFPNWNNPENKCWNITLIGKDARSEAPLIGVVNNHFADANSMKERVGDEDGIQLEPKIVDILRQRSRAGLKDLQKTMDEEHATLLGFITKGQISKLALREHFLPGIPFVENDQNSIDISVPEDLSQRLNRSQIQAIEIAI